MQQRQKGVAQRLVQAAVGGEHGPAAVGVGFERLAETAGALDDQSGGGEVPNKAFVLSLIVALKTTIMRHMNIKGHESELLVDTLRVKEWIGNASDKRGKIARMIRAGELLQLRRGLYAMQRGIHPYCLAASIYGPSYISFETALSFHGLIPEAVHEITSATLKRAKAFENVFGRYRYCAVPRKVFSIGIERRTEGGMPFLIASPTKALCDRIALEPRMRSMSDVRQWAELMRLNEEHEFDPVILAACAEGYRRPAVRFLRRTVEKYGGVLS